MLRNIPHRTQGVSSPIRHGFSSGFASFLAGMARSQKWRPNGGKIQRNSKSPPNRRAFAVKILFPRCGSPTAVKPACGAADIRNEPPPFRLRSNGPSEAHSRAFLCKNPAKLKARPAPGQIPGLILAPQYGIFRGRQGPAPNPPADRRCAPSRWTAGWCWAGCPDPAAPPP